MQPIVPPFGYCLLLFLVMAVLIEVGRRVADRRRAKGSEDDRSGLTTVEGAVFALFGLMIAFTFSGAASRYNEKRLLVAEEASAIETAYLRLELLPADARVPLQDLMREYADSRIETYRRLPNLASAEQEMARSKKIAEEIWTAAVAGSRAEGAHPGAGVLLLPALNAMADMLNTRSMALYIHPPAIVYYLLFGLGALCALLAGFRMAGTKHSWVHILTFITITVSVVYVTLDVEYPRWGVIRVQEADQLLLDVRKAMH